MARSESIQKSDPEPSSVPEKSSDPLIPGLPEEIAEQCLLHLPFPYHPLARSVSSSWSRALPAASLRRSLSTAAIPYLFVFAFHRPSQRLRWLALDPISSHWLPLPPMPLPSSATFLPSSFATASLPRSGELFVLGGMRADTHAPLPILLSYRAATNSWLRASPMPTPRAFFAAGAIGGRIFAVGGGDLASVDRYDPAVDRWSPAACMRRGIGRYDAAVLGQRMYVTEGWTWPFDAPPRGGVYDADRDTWEEMGTGMKEGWTGLSAVVGGKLFVISECGEGRVKAYDAETDTWRMVSGGVAPAVLAKPYAACGVEGRLYLVGSGLDVGVGRVVGDGPEVRIEWEVVSGPREYADLAPISCQVLYA